MRNDILRDRQFRNFFHYLTGVLLLASLLAIGLWGVYGHMMKKAYLAHDRAAVSSLLDQGVEERIVAEAFTQKTISEEGKSLLARMGIHEETGIFFLQEIFQIQKTAAILLAGYALLLWISVLFGACLFFAAREKLYGQGIVKIEKFMSGDFSEHLKGKEEGGLYRMFGKIDTLANALNAQNQIVQKTKDFLKSTISDISHQLKTPLASLTMYNEMIEMESGNQLAVEEFCGKASASLHRIEELIEALLKITKLDAGVVIFEKQPWPLCDVAARASQDLSLRAEREGKELSISGAEEIWVNCDLQWTGEAVGNLIKNALDYTEKGAKIEVKWEALNGMARLSVSDNGKGIAQEDFYHIFKRFYRAGKKEDNRQGIGLGLSLAKSIIEEQGGTLSVKSEAGTGSTFMISFYLTKL